MRKIKTLKQKLTQLTTLVSVCILVILSSCLPNIDSKNETLPTENIEELFSYKTIEIPVTAVKTGKSKITNVISAKASIESMYLQFELDLSKITHDMLPVSSNKKDTLSNTVFNLEFNYAGKIVPIHLNKKKHKWLYRNGFDTQADSTLSFVSGEQNLTYDNTLSVSVPMYVFGTFSSNKKIDLQVRVWQDYFLSERKEETVVINNISHPNFFKDTLKTKLIDNTYTFNLTVPDIYKTDFICDSIILQNDTSWSPYGSDHTLFKSSLPDIYFSLEDYAGNLQSSSHVEKSSVKFLTGDTLTFYHYQENEPFFISVYDFDVLSKNDLLGSNKAKLTDIKNNKRYKLKFGHVAEFYLKKNSFGKIN